MYTPPVTMKCVNGRASALPQFYHRAFFASLLRLCYNGCGSQSDNEGSNIPGRGKISIDQVSDWRKLWQANKFESIQYMTGLFHCSWGCARDYINGNKSGTILGFANEGKVAIAPIQVEPKVAETAIDPMETLVQAKLVLIEVALASKGLMARCTTLSQGIETAIEALQGVNRVESLLDTNDDLNNKLNAAQHGLDAANKYIEELKIQLGMSH